MESKKAKVISFYYQKGGVGKTTAAINIAAYFSTIIKDADTSERYKVLMIDGDPHASSTKYFGVYNIHGDSIYDVFKGKKKIVDVVKHFEYSFGADQRGKKVTCSLDFVPSSEIMREVSTNYFMLKRRDKRFQIALDEIINDYDYIIIDCPPQDQALFKNIFNVTDYFILVTEALTMDIDSLGHTYRMINELTTLKDKHCGKVLGVLIDRYVENFRIDIESNTKQKDVVDTIAEKFPVFKYRIPFSECICSSVSRRMPLPFYHKNRHNSKDTHYGFIYLTKEIIEKIEQEETSNEQQ